MVSDDALLRGGMFSALPVEPERAVEPIVESVVSAPLISARTGLRLRRPGAPHWSEMFSGEVYSAPLDGAGGPAAAPEPKKDAKKALKKVSQNLEKASKMHGEQSKALAKASKTHAKDAKTTSKVAKGMKDPNAR